MENVVSGTATSTDGTRIGWTRRGGGPPLVMVSCVMASRARTPQPALPALLAEHFSVTTYDRRGTGTSDRGRAPYAVEREFDDLDAVLDLAGRDATVYGFSSGATLALLAAADGLPIQRLVLNEPPLIPEPDSGRLAEARRRLDADPADARRWFDEEVSGIPPEVRAGFPPPTALDLANAAAMLHELSFLPGTTPERFRDVAVPSLLLASESTAEVLLASVRGLGDTLPRASVRLLPGRWHGIADDLLVAEIAAFAGRPVEATR